MARTDDKMRLVLLMIIVGGLAMLVCAHSAGAQSPQKSQGAPTRATPDESRGWSVRCANAGHGLACKAVQTIVLAKTHQLLLSASVNKPAGGDKAALLLQLPHGLFNPAGVTVAIDDAKPATLQIQTCDAKGCYVGQSLDQGKLAAMRKGQKLLVGFQNLKRQTITVPLPLQGFADAYKKL